MQRYAVVSAQSSRVETIERYLPDNYRVIGEVDVLANMDNRIYPGHYAVIQGEDNAGWTLDAYVIPRLASGLIAAREIDPSHPIMKLIPDNPA